MVSITGIRVQQWLPDWDEVPTDPTKHQSPPPREFYVASMRASQLRALSDVHQRAAEAGKPRAEDTFVQRTLEQDRTAEIRQYIRVGYPLSSLGARKMSAAEERSLRKPGWLPSALIANVIPAGDERGPARVADADAMKIDDNGDGTATISFPDSWVQTGWSPSGAHPLEIIDGQHRLSAFEADGEDDFELPVVLFSGLDFSWQAYLFWTVNIKPKRINASLAFDLYPLLREQDWLDAGESLHIYRETRAQELVETLWGDPRSVWYDRINMLGQSGMRAERPVTQAAFVRSLTTSFVRSFKGYKGFGGLFGGNSTNTGLNWPRGQQAAFLIRAWADLANAIHIDESSEWAMHLRGTDHSARLFEYEDARTDPAFVGNGSLLASDQGVRGFHIVLNNLTYLAQSELALEDWRLSNPVEVSPASHLEDALMDLETNKVGDFLRRVGAELSTFDWRNSRGNGLSEDARDRRKALRGTGGYNVLRDWLFAHLAQSTDTQIAGYARTAQDYLDD